MPIWPERFDGQSFLDHALREVGGINAAGAQEKQASRPAS